MSRKTQVLDFLRQQSRNRTEQADMLGKSHAPNAQSIGKMRDAARLFEDAAKMVEAYEGPITTTAAQTDAAAVREARAAEVEAPKIEAPKVRKKWTRKAIADSKQGPAIAANDRD